MKNALIDPITSVDALTSWVLDTNTQKYLPVFTPIENSGRVAEVLAEPFSVAPPLYWLECGDDVVVDQWYCNTATNQILVVPPPAPKPVQQDAQPSVSGAQTL